MNTSITPHAFIAMPPEQAAQHLQSHSKEVIQVLVNEAKSGKLTLNDAFKVIKILNAVDDTKAKEVNRKYSSAIKELIQTFDKEVKNFHDTFTATPRVSINKTTHQYQKSWFAGKAYDVADLLTDAIKKGHFEIVENTFENYAQIDEAINSKGETYLEVAVAHDYSPMIQKYLESRKRSNASLSGRIDLFQEGKFPVLTEGIISPPRPLHCTNEGKNILHLLANGKSPNCAKEVQKALYNDKFLEKVLERALHQIDNDKDRKTPLDTLLENPIAGNENTARLFLELSWNLGDMKTVGQLTEKFGNSILMDFLESKNRGDENATTYFAAILISGDIKALESIASYIKPNDMLHLLKNKEHFNLFILLKSYKKDQNEIFLLTKEILGKEGLIALMRHDVFPGCNAFIYMVVNPLTKIITAQIKDILGEQECSSLIYEKESNPPFRSLFTFLNNPHIITSSYINANSLEYILFELLPKILDLEPSEFLKDLCQSEAQFIPFLLKSKFFTILLRLQKTVPGFLEALDKNGNHPLHHYAKSQQFSVVNLLKFISLQNETVLETISYILNFSTLPQMERVIKDPAPYFESLGKQLSPKNHQGETPLEIAIIEGNIKLLGDLMDLAKEWGYKDMPALINKSVNVQNPYFLNALLQFYNEPHEGKEELFTYLIKANPQLPFALALQGGDSRLFFQDALSDELQELCLMQYPSLQQFSYSHVKTIRHLLNNLNAHPRAQLLEIGLFIVSPGSKNSSDSLLREIIKTLTPEEYLAQRTALEKRFPELVEIISDRLDFLHLSTNKQHMRKEELPKLEIDKALLAPFNYEDIYSGFQEINFSDKTKPGYRDPNTLKNDVGTRYVPVTVKQLDEALNKLFHTFIPNNTGVEGTPPIGTPELEQYYTNLKEQYQEVLYHMDQLKRLKELNPEASEADIRDAADAISRGYIAIAISALHCGSRWQEEVEDTIKDLKGMPESLEEILKALMGTLRSSIAETIAYSYGTDSHTRGTVFSQLAMKMAIPGASRIIEHLTDRRVKEADTIWLFEFKYIPSAMYKHLLQKMEEKPKVKAAVLEWFKDNPGTWHKEEYAEKLAIIKEDPSWQALMNKIHTQPATNTSLSRAFRNINIPKDLPEILADIDYEMSQKPEDYSILIEALFRKTHSELNKNDPKQFLDCCSLLNINPSLQTAFHEWVFSQLPDYKQYQMQATAKLTAELDKIEKGAEVLSFLKKRGVSVDRQMAEKIATKSNYNDVLANLLEKQRGEEFAKEVYFSPGSEFIDKFLELALENDRILYTLYGADTPEKLISFFEEQWKAIFGDQHQQALVPFLQRIKHDKNFAESCRHCLLAPHAKNQEHLKELLLKLPYMNYQFQRPQLLRMLQSHGFIQTLS